jgi:GT2 family glycosyltransferase
MTNSPADIAFVTVNYNTRPLVEEMLHFFRTASLPFSHTLVVVDNDSTDGSQELLSTQDDILYIAAGGNLGYGRGINRGIRAVESRYVCVLNTDVVLNTEALTQLWEFMEQTSDAGVVSPRVANRDGSTQGFVFYKSTLSIIFNTVNKIKTSTLKMRLARETAPMRVQGVLGAFFLIRRSLIPTQGLFDEEFFFYYEDTDLAHRLFDAGVSCYVLPKCSVIHLGGSSTSIEGARKFFLSKNLYLRKHYGNSFARSIETLDRVRLRMKLLKYSALAALFPAKRLAQKKAYYAAMQHYDTTGGNV